MRDRKWETNMRDDRDPLVMVKGDPNICLQTGGQLSTLQQCHPRDGLTAKNPTSIGLSS